VKIAGARAIAAPRQRVWDALQDPELLRRTLPGCQSLVADGNGAFTVRVEMGVGAIKGAYAGEVRLEDLQPPAAYAMRIKAKGTMGFVDGAARIALAEAGTGTSLSYDADATVGGLVAGVGQRMIAGVAKVMLDQFFRALDKELTTPRETPT
jgi:hypothetical protein